MLLHSRAAPGLHRRSSRAAAAANAGAPVQLAAKPVRAVAGTADMAGAPLPHAAPSMQSARQRRMHVRAAAASAASVPAQVPSSGADAGSLPYAGKKAVVVGAGPAGSCAAMVLAKQGFSVDVFERRPEPKEDVVDSGRAYIIILIPRGQATLEQLGIPLPSSDQFKSLGTVRHDNKGKVSVSKEGGNITFSRNDLSQFLVDEARARYPGRINYHFNAELSGVDLAGKKASFKTASGDVAPGYDLLVGADGAGSAVRSELQKAVGATVEVSDSGREYKVYMGLRGEIEPPEFQGKIGSTLHLYTTGDPFTTVTAHSNPDGTYSGTFSMRTGEHATFTTQAAYEALLREKFPGLPADWVPEIAKQAMENKASPAGKRIKCSQLHGPGVLLLGDAAHAVTPVFGQGANSALESCRILDDVLSASVDKATGKGALDKVPPAFSEARTKDVHALFWIDAAAYSFFAKKPGPDFFALLAHVLLGTVASKVVPFLYGPKVALLSLGSQTPYSTIYDSVKRDAAIAIGIAGSLLAFGGLKLTGVL